MTEEKRQHPREEVDFEVSLYWETQLDKSAARVPEPATPEQGMSLGGDVPIEIGTSIYMDTPNSSSAIEAVVRYCIASAIRSPAANGKAVRASD